MDSTTNGPQGLAAFQRSLAAELLRLCKMRSDSTSDLAHAFSDAGLPAPVFSATDEVSVPAPADEPEVAGDVKFSDLNPEAQRRLVTGRLRDARRKAYLHLKNWWHSIWDESFQAEAITSLQVLGLPVPVIHTRVEGIVWVEGGSVHGESLNFTLPRAVTQEEAQEMLDAVSIGSPGRRLVLANFPGAVDTKKPATQVYIDQSTVWPEASTIE